MRQHKNIAHLLNSESFLPASSVSTVNTPKPFPQRSSGSLIKTVCNDCINTQQIISRKQQRSNQLSEDKVHISKQIGRDQQRKIEQQNRKKVMKSQLSVDISAFIKSQQEHKEREKHCREITNARERQMYIQQERKLRLEEQNARRLKESKQNELRCGIESQINEKSVSRSRRESFSSLQSSFSLSNILTVNKQQKKQSQNRYHQQLDQQAKSRKQSREKSRNTQIENDRRRLKEESEKEHKALMHHEQVLRQKILKQQTVTKQNSQLANIKRVSNFTIQEQVKRQKQQQRTRVKQQPLTVVSNTRKVCIELQEAMLAVESNKQNSRSRHKRNEDIQSSKVVVAPVQVKPPIEKACCEGCHEYKSHVAFGNFML